MIVPTRDAPQYLERCLESLFSRTTYPSFDVLLVDNGTTDPAALRLFERYPIDVLPFDEPFNFSRINNAGVAHARGELVVFLNNDTEVQMPGVARGDGEPRRADGSAPSARCSSTRTAPSSTPASCSAWRHGRSHHARLSGTADGYAGSLSCTREVSAVTAPAC